MATCIECANIGWGEDWLNDHDDLSAVACEEGAHDLETNDWYVALCNGTYGVGRAGERAAVRRAIRANPDPEDDGEPEA